MRVFLILFALVMMALPARAQTVDYDLPKAFELVPGRLAVTFGETVGEAEGRALVEAAGFEVVQAWFTPVTLWAGSDEALTPDQLGVLETLPGVLTVAQENLEANLRAAAEEDPAISANALLRNPTFSRFQITLTFDPATTEDAARAAAHRVAGLHIHHVSKPPNELIIAVPEGEEEAIIAQLDVLDAIKYVSYVDASMQ